MNIILGFWLEDPHPVKVLSMPFDKLMLAYVIVTAVAAITAVITLLTIRRQVEAMREQLQQMKAAGEQTNSLITTARDQVAALSIAAEATKQSAEAAALNAEALINSERAWILVEIGEIPNFQPNPNKLEILWIRPMVRNYGKTVA